MANAAAYSLLAVLLFGMATASTCAVAGRVDGPVLLALAVGGVLDVALARPLV